MPSAVCCLAAGRSNTGAPTAVPLDTRPRAVTALHRRSPFLIRSFKPMSHGENCPPPRFLRAQTSARACRAEFLPRFCHWATNCSAAARGAVSADSICSAAARGAVLVGFNCGAAARGAVLVGFNCGAAARGAVFALVISRSGSPILNCARTVGSALISPLLVGT